MKQTLEELALNILIEGQFNTLPLKITHLAKVNKVDYLHNFGREKFANCINICQFILESENLEANHSDAKQLAKLIMAPKCVLTACKITNVEHLHLLTSLPIKTAALVFESLYDQNTESVFVEKEKQVILQFESFIHQQLDQKPHFYQ